jgi:hypothetical protein
MHRATMHEFVGGKSRFVRFFCILVFMLWPFITGNFSVIRVRISLAKKKTGRQYQNSSGDFSQVTKYYYT